MGIVGKSVLFGFGGFFLMGAIAMPFIEDPRTPEQLLDSGKRYFASTCSDVTRNRHINGRLGRGPAYCDCVMGRLSSELRTGEEFRYSAKLQEAGGAERWVFAEARIEAGVKAARTEFTPILGEDRVSEVGYTFFSQAKECIRGL